MNDKEKAAFGEGTPAGGENRGTNTPSLAQSRPNVKLFANGYQRLGFDSIPLRPGSKLPAGRWRQQIPLALWNRAPYDANLGLLLLLKHAAIDCDDDFASECVRRWLEGLGYGDPARTLTKRGGHYHLLVTGELPSDKGCKDLDGLSGDFRWRDRYVVSAPSVVDGWRYQALGDWASIPVVDARDLSSIVSLRSDSEAVTQDTHTVCVYIGHLLKDTPTFALPREAKQLAVELRDASKGDRVGRFDSRSEALRMFWVYGVSANWGFRELYQELAGSQYTQKWLIEDYDRTFKLFLEERAWAYEGYIRANELIPVRRVNNTHDVDVAVYQACCAMGWRYGHEFYLHRGTISRIANIGERAVSRSMRRLHDQGLLVYDDESGNRNRYRMHRDGDLIECEACGCAFLPPFSWYTKCRACRRK